MSLARTTDADPETRPAAEPPQSAQNGVAPPPSDPLGQSPEAPIEFTAGTEVARGNAERANAEPEPAALHSAETPGVPDVAAERRHEAATHGDS